MDEPPIDLGPPPDLEIFGLPAWQMPLGERAALEGLLSQLKPRISIEIGTAEGGSLSRIATHSELVHSIDLVAPSLALPGNVVLHGGDSKQILPLVLEQLVAEGRNVDFALVDGDHTPEGVRADVENLLASPAVARTVILMHDTASEDVREGLSGIDFEGNPKVTWVELDWIAGHLFRDPRLRDELYSGLGMVVVDEQRSLQLPATQHPSRWYPPGDLLVFARNQLLRDEPQG